VWVLTTQGFYSVVAHCDDPGTTGPRTRAEATLARIGERFGPEVERIVAACGDTFETPKPPWHERQEAYLEPLEHAAPDELRVSLPRPGRVRVSA